MSEPARHIVCPDCLSIDRVPAGKPAGAGKCGRCRKALFTGRPVSADRRSFDMHVKHNDIPIVVDFWAEWCGPCKAMAPVYERCAAEFEPALRFLKVDTEAEPQLASLYGIRGIPTMILFEGGKVAAQRIGAVDGQTLRSWLRQHAVSAGRSM